MTTPIGDLPDWETLVSPNITSASFANIGAGLVDTLLSSPTPYRIWGVWIDVTVASAGAFTGGPVEWGAQIGDGSGLALIRVQRHIAVANQNNAGSLSIQLPGFTPKISSGNYTTNLITDTGITNLFTRASGGILYSIP